MLLFKALNIHTGWRGSGLLPSPPPRNRELGAQALPGIGHGPPGRPGSQESVHHQLGRRQHTMRGCPGLWPPKTKGGWETALSDPFIPGAGPATQPGLVQAARAAGPSGSQAPGEDMSTGPARAGEMRERETPLPHTHLRFTWAIGTSEPCPPCAPPPRTHVDPLPLTLCGRPCCAGRS